MNLSKSSLPLIGANNLSDGMIQNPTSKFKPTNFMNRVTERNSLPATNNNSLMKGFQG